VQRRVDGEPLQHILGYADFRGLRIEVTPDVMIPRPETEEVVTHALSVIQRVESPRVLDVGTGSGCIALALKAERPAADVHACDVSADALAVAQRNADRLGYTVDFTEADVLQSSFLTAVDPPYDLIVSNPPYIPDAEADTLPATVREYDPPQALFAGADPLRYYRALVRKRREGTSTGGAIVLEVHADYGQEVAALLRSGGAGRVTVETDMADRERVVVGRFPSAD
jgi:release factor glutamine methyltransferase